MSNLFKGGRRRFFGSVVMAVVCLCDHSARANVIQAAQATDSTMTMKGQTVLITGSTDGLGRELALRASALGAHVIVHGRNQERGQAVVAEIAKAGKGSARFYSADLASLDEVRRLSDAVRRDYKRLDVLVNNAGVWLRDRQVSKDGHEMHFAVNYLSGFLLTRSLLPLLTASAPARVINIASVAQSPIDFTDVMLERPGRAAQGYGQSKLAQILFTLDLAEELKGRRVSVAAIHPATMMDTTMVRQSGMSSRTSIGEGADAVMRLIAATEMPTGQYFNGQQPSKANAQAYDVAARAALRTLSEKLTGLDSAK